MWLKLTDDEAEGCGCSILIIGGIIAVLVMVFRGCSCNGTPEHEIIHDQDIARKKPIKPDPVKKEITVTTKPLKTGDYIIFAEGDWKGQDGVVIASQSGHLNIKVGRDFLALDAWRFYPYKETISGKTNWFAIIKLQDEKIPMSTKEP